MLGPTKASFSDRDSCTRRIGYVSVTCGFLRLLTEHSGTDGPETSMQRQCRQTISAESQRFKESSRRVLLHNKVSTAYSRPTEVVSSFQRNHLCRTRIHDFWGCSCRIAAFSAESRSKHYIHIGQVPSRCVGSRQPISG